MNLLRLTLLALLVGGALFSGVSQWRQDEASARLWRDAPAAQRREMLLLEYAPVIARVEAQVAPEAGLVVVAGVDPALLPYYLHPRPIWQPQVEPETDRAYMELPLSPFPRRDPRELPGRWLLRVDRETLRRGGILLPLGGS